MANADFHIVLFFSRGVSLGTWQENGALDRETALYRRLQKRGVRVSFVTYGGKDDLHFADRLPGIDICCNRWGLPRRLYCRLLPLLHRRVLGGCGVIKCNQTTGAEEALRAARWWRKPFISRCGYMWSEFEEHRAGEHSRAANQARNVEKQAFLAARRVVVTTPMMADDAARRIPEAAARIRIIPNYVDTAVFKPLPHSPGGRGDRREGRTAEFDLAFIGRLAPQKNLEALLDAIRPLDVRLLMIGNSDDHGVWQSRFAAFGGRITWLGNVANTLLPQHLSRASVFILPSHYEGHPKALIEAMACAMPVIGADAPGIRELLQHGVNGYLCGTSAADIRQAIVTVLGDTALRQRLAANACRFANHHFSLDKIVDLELEVIREAMEHPHARAA